MLLLLPYFTIFSLKRMFLPILSQRSSAAMVAAASLDCHLIMCYANLVQLRGLNVIIGPERRANDNAHNFPA